MMGMLRPARALALIATLGPVYACQDPAGAMPSDGGLPDSVVFPASEFWQPIAADAAIDPGSSGYIADLRRATKGGRINVNLNAYNVPVYTVDATTAPVPLRVSLVTPQSPSLVPIPAWARPAMGDDAHMVILDLAAGKSYELWQARPPAGASGWGASVAVSFDARGDGINHAGTGVRATGISLLLGLIGYDEIKGGGPIRHALAWAFDKPSSLYFTPPAAASDGKVNGGRATAIPAGARLQLDPALDLNTLGLSPAGRRLAEALQRYGLICVDTSGDSSVVAEALYGDRRWDGLLTEDALQAIPVDRLRVLRLQKKVPIP